MFLNDRKSTDRLGIQRTLFSLWIAVAALMVVIAVAAGLSTSSHAAEMVDTMHTSAIASAPISKASDRIFVIGLVMLGFVTMAVGGIVLTLNSIREASARHRND